MTTSPKTKLTFKSLADEIGTTEDAVKSLLRSNNLNVETLTHVQIEAVKSELSTGLVMKSPKPPTPKVTLVLDMSSNLSVPTVDIELEDMTLEQILEANKKSEDDAKRLEAIAVYRANQKNLIALKEKNLSATLETEASKASYDLRLNSQSELLSLTVENAKKIQSDINQREIQALNNTVCLSESTPTPMEIREGEAKKLQALSQNRLTQVTNSIPELIPMMRLSGANTENQVKTLEAVVN